MIEEIRKNNKLVKLLNGFYIAMVVYITTFILGKLELIQSNLIIERIVNIGPSLMGSVAFQLIFVCVTSYLGGFKNIFNANWITKITGLNFIFALILELSKSMVSKAPLNLMNLILVVLGIILSSIYIYSVDNNKSIK